MKEKLTEKYLSKYYKNYLLDQLRNLRQGHMSVQHYIATFDLTCRFDVREHRSHTITRFVLGLNFKIKRDMIVGSYDLDTVEEALDVTSMIDLIFKRLVNDIARCSKHEGYGHYDYQYPSNSRHVSFVSII